MTIIGYLVVWFLITTGFVLVRKEDGREAFSRYVFTFIFVMIFWFLFFNKQVT